MEKLGSVRTLRLPYREGRTEEMKNTISVIIQEIGTCKQRPLLIAIDGRCAAGKTTLAGRLEQELNCNVIHISTAVGSYFM